MKKCKYCGNEFSYKSNKKVFCSKSCANRHSSKTKYISGSTALCSVCGKEFEVLKFQSKTKCHSCIAHPRNNGVVRLEDRELSSEQLWYIAEDVARGEPIDAAAAVFGWIGEKGFALFMSKLKKKEPEFNRYLKTAREQKKAKRCG